MLLVWLQSPPPEAQLVKLDPEQMQAIADMASQGSHDQVIMLGFCVMLLSAIALMYAIR